MAMSKATEQPRTALLLIDIQEGFLHPTHWGPARSNPAFENHISSILSTYRSLTSSASEDSPHKIIHIAHASLSPASTLYPSAPGFAFQSFAAPKEHELVIQKNVNSAFIGTNLEAVLREHFRNGKGTLYIAGLSTDHCVSTTTRMAGNLWVCDARTADGLRGEEGEVVLIEDATAAWKKSNEGFDAELVHRVHVESLKEFATIKKTKEVLDEWEACGDLQTSHYFALYQANFNSHSS